MTQQELHVRTIRVASGAHFLSFVTDGAGPCPTLADQLGRLPAESDLVINADGLDEAEVSAVGDTLVQSGRLETRSGLVILVCGVSKLRAVFEESGLAARVLLESSLDDAFGYVLSRSWLENMLGTGREPTAR